MRQTIQILHHIAVTWHLHFVFHTGPLWNDDSQVPTELPSPTSPVGAGEVQPGQPWQMLWWNRVTESCDRANDEHYE